MAIRGAIAKQEITNKILETFEGSFCYEKEIRIPIVENGETIQIKCTLTAAKVNVERDGDIALPGANVVGDKLEFEEAAAPVQEVPRVVEPTAEEKQNVQDLLKSLGLI